MSISALSSTDSTTYWEELLQASKKSQKTQQIDDVATKLFTDLDTDGNGGVSLEESGLDQETYDALDTNRDGTVSLEELDQSMELQHSAMLTLMNLGANESGGGSESGQSSFDAMDTNQDGTISAEELAAALEKQKETMGEDTNSSRTGVAQKAKNFLVSLANRAYNAMTGTENTSQNINFKS
jgi:Ca2+-binding EF-hand superfamily protein